MIKLSKKLYSGVHRLTFSKSEAVIQFNDNLMAQFNEGMGHKRIRAMFENTRNHVKKLETLRNNEHDWNPIKYANVLHHNRTEK